jgi:hypothetical protein
MYINPVELFLAAIMKLAYFHNQARSCKVSKDCDSLVRIRGIGKSFNVCSDRPSDSNNSPKRARLDDTNVKFQILIF